MINFVQYEGTVDQFKNLPKSGNYTDDSIVFIKGGSSNEGAAVYVNGKFYANLNELKYLSYIQVGSKKAVASDRGGTIEFTSNSPITVDINDDAQIEIGLDETYKNTIQQVLDNGIIVEESDYTVNNIPIKETKDIVNKELVYLKNHAEATFTSKGTTVEEELQNIVNDYPVAKVEGDTLVISSLGATDNSEELEIIDNLDSTSTTAALSANMGRELKNMIIDAITTTLNTSI